MRLLHMDAFTNKKFSGNPAAVCLIEKEESAELMQSIASEMNLSETAFVWRMEKDFGLRWFTPTVEVPLCGHATLATASALFELGECKPNETIRFHTKSGVLTSERTEMNGQPAFSLNFPSDPVTESSDLYSKALGLQSKPLFVGINESKRFVLVEIESADEVAALKPDFSLLSTAGPGRVIVTARAKPGTGLDFVSRFFAPAIGLPEDPVTGAAHCCLASYWAMKFGKTKFNARQVSKWGGDLSVELLGDRVKLIGQAVTVFKTELTLPVDGLTI